MAKINKQTQIEKMYEEYANILRQTFETTPLLLVGDFARVVKDATIQICDEYIQKSDDFQKLWALEIVRKMAQEEDQKSEEGGEEDE